MTLKTLADVRKLISRIPKERRELSTWQRLATTPRTSALHCRWQAASIEEDFIAMRPTPISCGGQAIFSREQNRLVQS
jgi:hypothetical protein